MRFQLFCSVLFSTAPVAVSPTVLHPGRKMLKEGEIKKKPHIKKISKKPKQIPKCLGDKTEYPFVYNWGLNGEFTISCESNVLESKYKRLF